MKKAKQPNTNADLAGMTVRDFFALAAIQGILASYSGTGLSMVADDFTDEAGSAYAVADAMLKARGK